MSEIEIVEVGPRDGLQNEAVLFNTAQKLELIRRAIDAGVRRIEAASFVNPKLVPQMADAEAVSAGLTRRDDVIYIGLVLNKRGALRAIEAGLDELGAVCAASDGFALRNQGQTSDESLAMCCEVVRLARQAGRRAQITISTAFGCPFDGEVDPQRVVAMAKVAAAAGSGRGGDCGHHRRRQSARCRESGDERPGGDCASAGTRAFSQYAKHRFGECLGGGDGRRENGGCFPGRPGRLSLRATRDRQRAH